MISEQVKSYIPVIQGYFKTQPVLRAWLFGSCSRGEENPESDIDLLVDYDFSQKVSLLTICRMMNHLEDALGRPVDMVESAGLRSFAIPSANRDKILIYEREA
ncbi:MAG: nucleotidyltransferase domain-containing protein [Bacteroidales bacterium]|nr:nucleotidyltransferase domain-containing protein [Bacteroidales bacterium]